MYEIYGFFNKQLFFVHLGSERLEYIVFNSESFFVNLLQGLRK